MVAATPTSSGTLIAADKGEGAPMSIIRRGEKLGSVDDIMIDKASGRAIYAVMSFGGFLGMGEEHYPLPWATLKYDAQKGRLRGQSGQEAAGRRAELRSRRGVRMDARLRPPRSTATGCELPQLC